MRHKYLANALLSSIILTLAAASFLAQTSPRFLDTEVRAILALDAIRSAEVTYAATGNATYGTLSQLAAAGLISPALGSGNKMGYVFEISIVPNGFSATATPRAYRRTGQRSFYVDAKGDVHGADKGGSPATASDPFVDSCAFWGISDNERCSRRVLRLLYNSELTFAATVGNGSYGSFADLMGAGLIRPSLASAALHGYLYTIRVESADLRITATPITYNSTGRLSYFIDNSGILRGADHAGLPADENDPPVQN